MLNDYLKEHRDPTRKKVSILNIDGGGVRGIIPIAILAAIEKLQRGNLQDKFDIYTGASVGSIIVSALNVPGTSSPYHYTAADILSIVKTMAGEIFDQSLLRKIFCHFGLFKAKYSGKNKHQALQNFFGDLTMDALNNMVVINTLDVHSLQTYLFGSRFSNMPYGEKVLVADATNASSAAPIYFSSHVIQPEGSHQKFNLVDGGMSSNNPELIAFTIASILYPNADIHFLSIGTGTDYPVPEYPITRDWGVIPWLLKGSLSEILFSAEQTLSSELLSLYEGDGLMQYLRVEPVIPKELEDAFNAQPAYLDQLIDFAKEYAQTIEGDLQAFFAILESGQA